MTDMNKDGAVRDYLAEVFACLPAEQRAVIAERFTTYRDEARRDGDASWETAQNALDALEIVEAQAAMLEDRLQ